VKPFDGRYIGELRSKLVAVEKPLSPLREEKAIDALFRP
jgi:hypothetical protein